MPQEVHTDFKAGTITSSLYVYPNQRMSVFPYVAIVQDSGGFQLVSLSKFTTITEEGALFQSPFTGEPTMLTVRLSLVHGPF